MKYSLVIIFIWLVLNGQAQNPIKAKIVDGVSMEPIPYVNIGIKKDGTGTVSDQNGHFELMIKDVSSIITISSIGYETKEMAAESLIGVSKIQMYKMDYQIEEVQIVATRFQNEEKIFGEKNKKRGHSLGFGSAQLGSEIGAAIRIEKPTYILSANIVLNHAKGDSLLLRINIYDFENKTVGAKILRNNVFIKDKQRKGVFTVDLSNLDLVLKNDVLLTVEWLRNFDELGNKEITFDTKKTRNYEGIYYKYSSAGRISKLNTDKNIKPCFYLIGKSAK